MSDKVTCNLCRSEVLYPTETVKIVLGLFQVNFVLLINIIKITIHQLLYNYFLKMTEFLEILTTNKKCSKIHAKGQTSRF